MSCEVSQGFDQCINIGGLSVDVAGSARGRVDAQTFEERQRRKISSTDGNAPLVKGLDNVEDRQTLKRERKDGNSVCGNGWA